MAWLVWLLYGRPWRMNGVRWAHTLTTLWEANIPAFREFMKRLRAGDEILCRVDEREIAELKPGTRFDRMPRMHVCDFQWWIERMVADRFAVREADEIERAECSLMPWRFELWLKYQLGVRGVSMRDLARERRVPVPVLAYYAWRFGIVSRWRCGWSWSELFVIPAKAET